jgi:lipopolysaccharide export system permease protein
MKVLERYILRRILIQSVAASMATLGIVWIVQALTKVNLVTDTGQSIGSFLYLSLLIIPAIVPIVMPFAVLIGTAQTLNTMNTDSEMAVVHGVGTPKLMIYRPIMIVALLAAAITMMFGNFVEPTSRQTARQLVSDARADLLSLLIQEGSFRQVDKNLFMQVSKREAGGILSGLFIADSRDPALDMIYYAKEGSVMKRDGTSLLLMTNGEIHRRSVKDDQVSIIRFSSYAFDLSEFSSAGSTPTLLPKDQQTSYLLNPDPNDPIFQKKPLLYSTELHRRLSEWLYPLAFAMIAIGACGMARTNRQPAAVAMINAVCAAFVLRWFGIFAEDTAEGSRRMAFLVYLVPLLGIFVPLWMASRNIPIEWPPVVRNWVANRVAAIQAYLISLRIRFSGFRRSSSEAAS